MHISYTIPARISAAVRGAALTRAIAKLNAITSLKSAPIPSVRDPPAVRAAIQQRTETGTEDKDVLE